MTSPIKQTLDTNEAVFNEEAESVSRGSFVVPGDGKNRQDLVLYYAMWHRILRTYWSNEFQYEVKIWQKAQGGPLLVVDRIDMHITREVDGCDTHVVNDKTGWAFDAVKFPGGPTGRSTLQTDISMWGYVFRTPLLIQSADRADVSTGLRSA